VAALRIIENNLVFAGGFRPDVIVARDSYESALTAYLTARRYQRPTQLHVSMDPLVASRPFLWRKLSAWLVSTFKSIRTITQIDAERFKEQYPQIKDIAELPKFHNFAATKTTLPAVSMKDIYKDFSFIVLYVGPLTVGRSTYHAIDAVRELFRNPRVGLVILGDGAGRAECVKRVELLGMRERVVFEKRIELLDDYIVPECDAQSEEVVLRAAVHGRPLVIAKTSARSDLFIERESALFFNPGDITVATRQLQRVLNDSVLRRQLHEAVETVVATRLHEDPKIYQQLYRESIEHALFAGDEDGSVEGV
jgi:glycosyltransferase involved in cell wall biosynthesis